MFDERFARQYRYGPPSAFRQTSTSSGIVHHLSGPDSDARLKPFTEDQGRLAGHALYFHCARGLATRVLASVSDSLVRVSRRVGCARSVSRTLKRAEDLAHRSPPGGYGELESADDPRRQSAPMDTAELTSRNRAQTGFLLPISSTL